MLRRLFNKKTPSRRRIQKQVFLTIHLNYYASHFIFFCGNLNYDRLEHFKDIFKVIFHFSSHLDTLKVDIKASKLTLGTNDGESKSMYFNLLY